MKYIDAEKLIALLEQRKKQLAKWTDKEYANQRIDEIDCILDVDINSLQQEQPHWKPSEEDEKLFWGFTAWVPNEELERLGVTRDDILKKLKSLRSLPIQLKEAYKDGFQTARHAIALAFMKYCDKIRPNGKMCLSNGECEEIEKAFLVGDWEKIERYFHNYS